MTERRWLAIIFGLYILFAFAYSWLMPPWEGPDEPAHYILAVNLVRVGIFSTTKRNYEAGQPQPYYRLVSVPLKWLHEINPEWVAVVQPERDYGNVRVAAPIFDWSDENYQFLPGLYLLRWLNILMGAGALGLNYAAMRRLSLKKLGFSNSHEENSPPYSLSDPPFAEKNPGFSPALAALALAALTPQFLHTTSSVANDTLGILAGAILFWIMSRSASLPLWGLGGGVILAFLLPYTTKLTVLPVGIALAIAIIFQVRARWPDAWRKFAIGGLVLGGGTLLLGVLLIPKMGDLFLRQVIWRALTISEDARTLEYGWEMVKQVVWSYWGLVGWLSVGLPGWVVVLLTGLGMIGVGVGYNGAGGLRRKGEEGEKKWVSWGVGLMAGLTVLAVLKNGLTTINSQGRFLFPAIGALALLMVSGWEKLLPARFKPYLLPAVIVLMIAANLILWFGGIIPVYYQPFWG